MPSSLQQVIAEILLIFVAIAHVLTSEEKNSRKVLLISVDGFRWDFHNKTYTPYLDTIVATGVTSEYVLNVFPTSTTPNHQSMITGLYPEHHGMLDNTFIDPETGKVFNKDDPTWWNQSVPLWIVNEEQGHKSGVIFWPGYRLKWGPKNLTASFLPDPKYEPYEDGEDMDMNDRIDLAVSWLEKEEVNFVVMHTNEPDHTVHNNGPDNNKSSNILKVKKAIDSVDEWVKYLNERLMKAKLSSNLDVILIGDHGHINTTYEQSIHLDDYVDTKENIRFISGFTNLMIYTKPGRTQYVYDKLKDATAKLNYTVYLKDDIPERLHIKNNSRAPDILLLPDPGWTATSDLRNPPYLKGEWERGDHGYDNEHRSMNPAFFAYGPSFKMGYKRKCIMNIDLYNLIAHILNIEPGKNDGKFDRIKSVLVDESDDELEERDTIECY